LKWIKINSENHFAVADFFVDGVFMSRTKTSFCFLLLAVLTFSACADEQDSGRKWCRKAAQVAGSLCLEGKSGVEGDVRIRVYGTTNVTEVNLSELGGSADAPRDGTPNSVNPGTGKVHWSSNNITHNLSLTLNAAPGNPGRYAPLIRPSGHGPKGETRTFTLFLAGSEYAFVWPE
jgi:hypothetical protein